MKELKWKKFRTSELFSVPLFVCNIAIGHNICKFTANLDTMKIRKTLITPENNGKYKETDHISDMNDLLFLKLYELLDDDKDNKISLECRYERMQFERTVGDMERFIGFYDIND